MSTGFESSVMRANTFDVDLLRIMGDPDLVIRGPTRQSFLTKFC